MFFQVEFCSKCFYVFLKLAIMFSRLLISCENKKNLVWYSHNFLLLYITVDEYFIISITFVFILYILCFVADELPVFVIIVYDFLT